MKRIFMILGLTLLMVTLLQFFMFILPADVFSNNSETISIIIFLICLLIVFLPKLISKATKINYQHYISLENIPTEFENIYEDLYNNHIYSLESMRKQVKRRTIFQYITFTIFIIGCMLQDSDCTLISSQFKSSITLVSFIVFIICILITVKNIKYKRKYKETYKKEIVSNFIRLINSQLEYIPLGSQLSILQEDYRKADFDKKRFNRFYSDDYIEGFIDNQTFIKMCDLHIQNRTGTGKNRHTEEIFQGIFAHTKCGKDIKTYIKISNNKLKLLKKSDRVELDSEEFEKYFDIYSENKIVTMQLLTSDIMESLVAFHNMYNLNYEIVFRNNSIYLRFFTGAMFEPKIFGSSMDKQLLFTYFCILKFIVDVSKKVNKTLQEIEV